MADVAAIAGVSHQTVSRVLNHPEKVRPETRARVEAAMAELDFRPNAAARALVTRSSRLIGLVLPGENLFGPTHTMVALDAATRGHGYSTTLGVLGQPGAAEQVLGRFLALNVDGVVVIAPDRAALDAAHALARRLPVVAICGAAPDADGSLSCVHIDQHAGALQAVRQLAAAGARRIDHLAGRADWFDARARVSGWRQALAEVGLPGDVVPAGWAADDGFAAAGLVLPNSGDGPAGLFCANDQLALGAMHRAAELGLRVPGDLLVVGFDDTDGVDHLVPALSSVRQPLQEAGQLALELLLDVMAGQSARCVTVTPELVVRTSSEPPAAL